MHIMSIIIIKGLTASHASFFEVLDDFYVVSMCDFRSLILSMILTEFLEDVGRGYAHGRSNPLFGPSHLTTMRLNY